MEIRKIDSNDKLINELIDLSILWAEEGSCEGYVSNTPSTFIDKQIYVVIDKDEVIAYLYGYFDTSKKTNSIQKDGDRIFEVDEIYVKKQYRNKGIGTNLYNYVENDIKDKVDLILLSTATKDYKKILHFYIDELDLTFWNARLFKKVK